MTCGQVGSVALFRDVWCIATITAADVFIGARATRLRLVATHHA